MRVFRHLLFSFALSVFLASISSAAPADDAASSDFFETKIRPVLATNCYGCHSSAPLGGLRLDSADGVAKGGSRGAAVVSGDPDKSLLISAIMHTDPKLKMPMGLAKLSDDQITDFKSWVKAGAPWPKTSAAAVAALNSAAYAIPPERKQFWSLVPLKTPEAPVVKDRQWAMTTIDKFVFSKMQSEGLKPVAQASKRDLLRRATLDLIGLPPTLDDIKAFEADKSPDAFAKVVDKLLASPQYGERWGRSWLDVARYGEDDYRSLNPNPKGYFPYPNAYLYRDWVIQAMNDDMPYDQFVKAQLAGDLMDEKTRYKTLPATGFLGLGPWYFDNGAVEVTRADERHDRVDVVTRGFLGLTVACARCHNHKYDPIPQTDYYALAGVFQDTDYHEYPRVPKATLDKWLMVQDQVDKKNKRLQTMQTDLSNQLSETLALKTSEYLQGVFDIAGPQKRDVATVVESRKLDYELMDRWVKYMAKTTDKYKTKDAWQAMMKKGGATAPQAKKLAEEFQAEVMRVMIARHDLDEENDIIYDQSLETTKKKKRANKPNEFKTNDDFCPNCGLRLKNMPESDNNLWTEIFQREIKDAEDPNAMMAAGGRQGNPGVLLFRAWGLESRIGASDQTRMASLKAEIDEQKKQLDPAYPYIHGVADKEKIVDLELAIRGNPQDLGDKVPRHFLSVFSDGEPEPFKNGSGRLELAEDILKQPIAMRVIVNRIWKGHFGSGIVDTPSNFGIGGERPTNPELLEYLAQSFVKNGMSMKALHREIMLTSTYQLGSGNDAENLAKDSGNRYYWHAEHRRMDAEQLRDSIMFVTGNLDKSSGGPSADLTPANMRRTVYGKVSRYKLDTYLQLFDFPSPQISAEKRFVTTVPLQRLFLMNSDFVQIEAEELVKKIAAEPNNVARIKKAHQLIYGSEANGEEIALGLEYLSTEPLKEYEEIKAKEKEASAKGGGRGARPGGGKPQVSKAAPAAPKDDAGKPEATAKDATVAEAQSGGSGMPVDAKPAADALATMTADAKPAKSDAAKSDMLAKTEGDAKPETAVAAKEAAADMPMDPVEAAAAVAAAADADMGNGMMGGVNGRRGARPGGAAEIKYDPSAWGRYAKVLLSSSEFLFIN
ncbi:MAG: PSD1 and planctomycete cytochrome C domain-containing protein [Acidobacteriota bacterium]